MSKALDELLAAGDALAREVNGEVLGYPMPMSIVEAAVRWAKARAAFERERGERIALEEATSPGSLKDFLDRLRPGPMQVVDVAAARIDYENMAARLERCEAVVRISRSLTQLYDAKPSSRLTHPWSEVASAHSRWQREVSEHWAQLRAALAGEGEKCGE